MIGIYGIRNKLNGKIYIGQTTDVDLRYKEHFSHLKNNCHQNSHLQNAWNKYGQDCFEFLIVEECSEDNLTEREQYWIDYYGGVSSKNTYNIREAGSKGRHSEETKIKLRNAHLGKSVSLETRQKISKAQKGINRIVTDEQKKRHKEAVIIGCNTDYEIERRRNSAKKQWTNTDYRNKMTNLWKGKHHTNETKMKQRKIAQDRCATPEFKKILAKANAKAVCQFDLNNNLLCIYPSVLEASRVTGISSGIIYYSCSNPNSKCKEYRWGYKKDVKNL